QVTVHFMSAVGWFPPGWRGVSDRDGRFQSVASDHGSFTVEAEAPEGTAILDNQPLGPGERKEVELTLAAGGALDGVVHWEDGPPAAGVLVKLFGRRHSDR